MCRHRSVPVYSHSTLEDAVSVTRIMDLPVPGPPPTFDLYRIPAHGTLQSSSAAGPLTLPASSQLLPAGLALLPAGLALLPAGLSLLPAGLALLPPGLVLLPPSLVLLPAGLALLPAGLVLLPPGLVLLPPGLVLLPANPSLLPLLRVNAASQPSPDHDITVPTIHHSGVIYLVGIT